MAPLTSLLLALSFCISNTLSAQVESVPTSTLVFTSLSEQVIELTSFTTEAYGQTFSLNEEEELAILHDQRFEQVYINIDAQVTTFTAFSESSAKITATEIAALREYAFLFEEMQDTLNAQIQPLISAITLGE